MGVSESARTEDGPQVSASTVTLSEPEVTTPVLFAISYICPAHDAHAPLAADDREIGATFKFLIGVVRSIHKVGLVYVQASVYVG